MEQLSRRSKDNAADLNQLRTVTNTRDEDIRKSLKDLVTSVNTNKSNGVGLFDGLSAGPTRSHNATPTKSVSLPRFPSPHDMFIDERVGSPNPYSVEGAASVAMLEKIIREMNTKEGQERLVSTLNQLFEKASKESETTAKKVTELTKFITEGSKARGLLVGGPEELDPATGALARVGRDMRSSTATSATGGPKAASAAGATASDFITPEMMTLLRSIKDSVAHSGGMTAETKALVRDLRSEVLGMGREIGRKIDEAGRPSSTSNRAIEDGNSREDLTELVQQGLADLKDHMERVIREKRRQSNASVTTVDSNHVQELVKHALAERGLDQPDAAAAAPGVDRESILAAVQQAFENYKPNIEVDIDGLQRDEILTCMQEQKVLEREEIMECLKAGLEEHRSTSREVAVPTDHGAILDVIRGEMQNFNSPAPANDIKESKEEILAAVRETLEDFKHIPASSREHDITREVVYDAIKEGMGRHAPAGQELDINEEHLFSAVKRGLEEMGYGESVMSGINGVLDEMRNEFKSYSSANGRDTEQVLDAMKDGMEVLRRDIETYVDRAQDVTGKDEIIDIVRAGLESLRADLETQTAAGPRGDSAILGYLKSEFESLNDALHNQVEARSGDRDITEELDQAMKEEFDSLRESLMAGHATHKDEVLETLHSRFDGLHSRLEGSELGSNSNGEILILIKQEFEQLRESLAGGMVLAGAPSNQEEIVSAVREAVQAESGINSSEALGSIQEELQHLRESLASTLVRGGSAEDKEEILDAIRSGLENVNTSARSLDTASNPEVLIAIQRDLEGLRESIATGMVQRGNRADTEEVLDAIRLGLDDLQTHFTKKFDNPERNTQMTSEVIDALNEGLESLKEDVSKMVNKPVDMTVSYEILDTLKTGLADLQTDVEKLKSGEVSRGDEVVLAEDGTATKPADAIKHADVEKLEVLITQLQIKIEAMDDNIQNQPTPQAAAPTEAAPGTAMKDDLLAVEEQLRTLQSTVDVIAARELPGVSDIAATKEDTDAIETLLRNTKAELEEIKTAVPEGAVTKDDLEALEAVVRMTNDALASVANRLDETTVKDDIIVMAAIETQVGEVKTALDELKSSMPVKEEPSGDKLEKSDLEALGLMCADIKAKVEEMNIPDAESLPAKADIEQLTGLINDFRESHDKMKDSYEGDISVTAQAFDDRKKEAESILEGVSAVKTYLEEIKEELKTSVHDHGETHGKSIEELHTTVRGLDDTIGTKFDVKDDVKQLLEAVTTEFEKAHGSLEGLKTDHEAKAVASLEKHDAVRDAIITDVSAKLDERFETIMSKYDDAQSAAKEQITAMEEKAAKQEELLGDAKAMSDELKVTIDTLGTLLSSVQTQFTETSEKLSEDSKTVFGRIEETTAKLDDNHLDLKTEHSVTREEIARTFTAIEGLQGDVTEFHPKFMVTLQELSALVKQHYEHSQTASEAAKEQAREATESHKATAEDIKSSLPTLLPALLPPPSEPVTFEKYDDTQLHEKLDKLMGHAADTEKSSAQLERLDLIHQQVMNTAAEVTAFVATQTQRLTEDHESKEKEAEELALLVERRLTQREQLDADIQGLSSDKESLKSLIAALKAEHDSLAMRKSRLAADVSSLETALHIRQEELQLMDNKADALERRILEGIMNQSRAMMINKSARNPRKADIQRVTSNASHSTLGALPTQHDAASRGLSIALKQPRPAMKRNGPDMAGKANRRIMSLSQITGNTPTGVQAYNAAVMPYITQPTQPTTGLTALKRSHSVKTPSMRKGSWNSAHRRASEMNKENSVSAFGDTLSEADELGHDDEMASNAGTERRYSNATATNTESGMTYGTGSYLGSEGPTPLDERRMSFGAGESDLTYGTGSYLTGSDVDRRTSYGSTIRSNLGDLGAAIHEEGEDEEDDGVQDRDFAEQPETPLEPETPAEERQLVLHDGTQEEESVPIHASEDAGEEDDTFEDAPAESVVESAIDTGTDPVEQLAHMAQEVQDAKKMALYTDLPLPSDSGLGSELPTATFSASGKEGSKDYFRRAAEE